MNKYDGHTPGPWSMAWNRDYVLIGSDESPSIASVYHLGAYDNARLIADAPTLLAQRDEAVALLRSVVEHDWFSEVRHMRDGSNRDALLAGRIDAFLSRLDSKEPGDASD